MGNTSVQFIPKEGAQILLVLFLSFLIGLEREEQKVASAQYRFGGVRTFPLLGLLGYALGLLSGGNLLLPAAGLAVVGAFLWQSYRYKLEHEALPGMTTELSGLVTYVIGALIWREEYWVATTLAVLGVALLELKSALQSFTKRVPGDEILTFTKFLLLSAVILPIVPNRTYGTFGFNPFKTWLVVVAVSAISYGSYLLQVWTQGRGGVLVAALLGGRIRRRSPPWCSPSEPASNHAPIYIPAGCWLLPVSCTCACSRCWASLTVNCSTGWGCRSCCSPPPGFSADGFGCEGRIKPVQTPSKSCSRKTPWSWARHSISQDCLWECFSSRILPYST